MSRMSELALEIECALDDGFTYDEIIQGLQNEHGFSRAEALCMINMVNQAVKYLDEAERLREIQAEAMFNKD